MIFFWALYLVISFVISYCLSFFFKKRLLKIFVFSFSLSLMISFWYKIPGENDIAPIFTIFFLENTILVDNGIMRLVRPLVLSILVILIITLIVWKKNSKN